MPGENFLGIRKKIESALVTRARAHRAIEAWNGFGVVVQHVRACVEDNFQRFFQPLKIGDQNFDAAI